jgi:C1A family cysteine protease
MSDIDLGSLRRAIEDEGYGWRAGPTSVSTLSLEQQEYRLGLRLEPDHLDRIASVMRRGPVAAAAFPSFWDWRDVDGADWTTPVKDQEGCGACVAFATVAAIEAMIKRDQGDAGLQPDLSEAHLFYCGCGDCCDRGWWPTYALDYSQSKGVPDEACFPYQDRNVPCSVSCADWQARSFKVVRWRELIDVGLRKEWLATNGPVIGCMAVYRDFYSYTGGIYQHVTGDLVGYHAICVVGYSELEQAWICKNSWGTDWGDEGWFKIRYGQTQIDTRFAMYGVEAVAPPSPAPEPTPQPGPQPATGCSPLSSIMRAIRSTSSQSEG